MKDTLSNRNKLIHLYNPKEEGIGSYDANYINAYKKDKNLKNELMEKSYRRHVA